MWNSGKKTLESGYLNPGIYRLKKTNIVCYNKNSLCSTKDVRIYGREI